MRVHRLRAAGCLVAAVGLAFSAVGQTGFVPGKDGKEADQLAYARQLVESFYNDRLGGKDEKPPVSLAISQDDKVIYGADDRLEPYQVMDPQLAAMATAACLVTFDSEVTLRGDGDYDLAATPWTTAGGGSLCADEPFRGQLNAGFCSGFLVTPTIVVTAGHCVGTPGAVTGAGNATFVFGFERPADGVPASTVIPADRVYRGVSVLSAQLAGDLDYAMIELDRPVTGITPVPMRTSGEITAGEPLAVIGHPSTIPLKVAGGANVLNPAPGQVFFSANLDTYGGNSGSMVINTNTYEVEGILVRGATDFVFNSAEGCVESNRLPDTGVSGEDVTKTTTFADLLPGLTVTTDIATAHGGPMGGPFTNETVEYTVTNGSDAPLTYEATLGGPDSFLMISGNTMGTLASGASDTFTVMLDSSVTTSLGNGIFFQDVVVEDTTNMEFRSTTHTLEIGRFVFAGADGLPGSIPDASPAGVDFTLDIADNICIADLDVDIDISHTFRGDLIVELTSPFGTTVRLANRTGSNEDDIVERYDDDTNAPDGPGLLADFNGESSMGTWTLSVSDNAGLDLGTLNAWSLRLIEDEACPGLSFDGSYSMSANRAEMIDLPVFDPLGGAPTVTITSLPARGNLWQSDGARGISAGYTPITMVPWTLPASSVLYHAGVDETGEDSFTFNSTNANGTSADSTMTVSINDQVAFASENFDSDPMWTTEGDWAFGMPQGLSGDPDSGFTGDNVYGYNLGGDYTNGLAPTALTTPAFDLSGAASATVSFYRWLGVESSTFDDAAFEMSIDGGATWITVWAHSGGSLSESSWSFQSYDITNDAAGQGDVRFRWVMGGTDGSVVFHGWNIDDFAITAPGIDLQREDINGDSATDVFDLIGFLQGFTISPATDMNGDQSLDVFDLIDFLTRFSNAN